MNPGRRTLDWLYREQLQIDPAWSIRTAAGFKWWPAEYAQTIEIAGEEVGLHGEVAHYIAIRTDFIRGLDLGPRSYKMLNLTLMPFASMAGPVYDPKERTLSLCSLVRVHAGIVSWINPLLSIAAVLQIEEARALAGRLAQELGATANTSGHPDSGARSTPDEMATVASSLIVPAGREPCKWAPREFAAAVQEHMQRPPALLASSGGLGLTVEFPYGDRSSLCQISGEEPHPRYGNGLFLMQAFPVNGMSDDQGAQLALSLNDSELSKTPWGYGLGSYCYRDSTLHFASFIPNVAYTPGLIPNLYFSCAQRACAISARITGKEWTANSFQPRRSTLGRLMARLAER